MVSFIRCWNPVEQGKPDKITLRLPQTIEVLPCAWPIVTNEHNVGAFEEVARGMIKGTRERKKNVEICGAFYVQDPPSVPLGSNDRTRSPEVT
jgi:hypothetical protein